MRSRAVKIKITLVSRKRKEKQYSRGAVWRLVHPARRHIGVNRHVKRTKKREIPSTPKANEKFADGIQGRSTQNWKSDVEESNWSHKNKERRSVKQLTPREITCARRALCWGTKSIASAPRSGQRSIDSRSVIIRSWFTTSIVSGCMLFQSAAGIQRARAYPLTTRVGASGPQGRIDLSGSKRR